MESQEIINYNVSIYNILNKYTKGSATEKYFYRDIMIDFFYFHDKCKGIRSKIETNGETYYTVKCNIIKIKIRELRDILYICHLSVVLLETNNNILPCNNKRVR